MWLQLLQALSIAGEAEISYIWGLDFQLDEEYTPNANCAVERDTRSFPQERRPCQVQKVSYKEALDSAELELVWRRDSQKPAEFF